MSFNIAKLEEYNKYAWPAKDSLQYTGRELDPGCPPTPRAYHVSPVYLSNSASEFKEREYRHHVQEHLLQGRKKGTTQLACQKGVPVLKPTISFFLQPGFQTHNFFYYCFKS